MKKLPTNIPASIRRRLLNKARDGKVLFQSLIQFYAMERFLHRLANSKYAQQFILKGGLVYLAWNLDIRRPTLDIDFQATLDRDTANFVKIIKEICAQNIESDGINFLPESVIATAIQAETDKPGIRLKFQAILDGAKIPMQVDISFGSAITPGPIPIKYPTILKNEPPELLGYPPETVIAEKYESMVSLGLANSRLKDIYDLRMLMENLEISGEVLQQAIISTFQTRGTELPTNVFPFELSEFVNKNQKVWNRFVDTITNESSSLPPLPPLAPPTPPSSPSPALSFSNTAPAQITPSSIPQSIKKSGRSKSDLEGVLNEISDFHSPIIKSTKERKKFEKRWYPKKGWKQSIKR